MDNRLKFLYCRYSTERGGDAGGKAKRAAGNARPRGGDRLVGKTAGRFDDLTGREIRVPKMP